MNQRVEESKHIHFSLLLIVSLSIPLIDTILSLLQAGSFDSGRCNIFLPLALLTVIFLVSTTILFWFVSVFARVLKLNRQVTLFSSSVFLIFFFVPSLLLDLLRVHLALLQFIMLGSIFIMSAVTAGTIFFALANSQGGTSFIIRTVLSSIFLPVILVEALALVWLRLVFGFQLTWPVNLGLLLIMVLTWWILQKMKTDAIQSAVLISVTILIIGSVFLPFFARENAVPQTSNASHEIKRIFLITIDTLRADALSCYSQNGTKTPNFDKFAKNSVFFSNAISPAPWTLPSLTSIMTGVNPLVHLAVKFNSQIPRTLPMLAESMNKAGYRTGAVGKNVLLKEMKRGFMSTDFYPRPERKGLGAAIARNLFKGWCPTDASSEQITDHATAWINQHQKEDFFFWVHYFDPHLPYAPPKQYLPSEESGSRIGSKFTTNTMEKIRMGRFVPNLAERKRIQALYNAEVRYVDAEFGRLIQILKEKQLYDSSLIIVTSDHAEEFWEHDHLEHGHTVYEELLHVPFFVKLPFGVSNHQSLQRVSTASIAPTILDLCGIPYSAETLTSPSLAPFLLTSAPVAQGPIVSSGLLYHDDLASVTFDSFKYIQNLVTGREEGYDLASDPRETNSSVVSVIENGRNLLADQQKTAKSLQSHYGISSERREIDRSTIELLKSLGYIN